MHNSITKYSRMKLFFVLCFVLAIPFWIIGAWDTQTISRVLPIQLPFSALSAFIPFFVAIILSENRGGFLGQIIDFHKIKNKILFIPLIFFMPLAVFFTYIISQKFEQNLPPIIIDIPKQIRFFLLFLLAAIGEEMGWTGFAFQRAIEKYNPLYSALLISLIWMAWHTIPYIQTGRSEIWIIGQIIGSIFERLLLFYLFLKMGRPVSLAILFHTIINVSEFTYPINGSLYNAPIMALVVAPFGLWAGVKLWAMRLKH